ncbi:unnamed protein product [Cylindrotheca closterium]|uniref:GPI inositol-deacylase n=1 Tax=Cylindrotheca closterium TaxID=2856 RepID=A0AAD2G8D1_9STRA|nr:unnamed protein product [Cylindrotheca closterium]
MSATKAEVETAFDVIKARTILKELAQAESTQTKLGLDQVKNYQTAIANLPPPPDSLDVDGGWDLLATISPKAEEGDNVDFFDANSWKNYISGDGPSPFQSLVTGSSRVQGLAQWLTPKDFDNVVSFSFGASLVLKADLEKIENNKRVFRFRRGFFVVPFIWGGYLTLPYPVPFNLLGDRAIGWLNTIGYDESTGFRAALGNKGTQFIFQRKTKEGSNEPAELSDLIIQASEMYSSPITDHETDEEERQLNAGLTKRPVILCPQQFGGKPGDYTVLTAGLRAKGHPVYLARISALQWLSIAKSAFSKAYFEGSLEPSKTLPFYNKAIDEALARMDANSENGGASSSSSSALPEFTLLSHSIGGWVARAWLGEVASKSVKERCKNYVSLGTPHKEPPADSIVAKVDQTRGLLKYINDRFPGAYYSPDNQDKDDANCNIEYTCVASKGVVGKLELKLDSILAFASYFALGGQGDVEGDGITPTKGALLDGGNSIILDDVCHANLLPNPIGGRNAKLLGCSWYADKLDEWVEAL